MLKFNEKLGESLSNSEVIFNLVYSKDYMTENKI